MRVASRSSGCAPVAIGVVPTSFQSAVGGDRSGPTLTDLRESGDLENTADSVIGLYRDEMDHPDSVEKGLAELIVLKKRQLGDDVGTVRRVVWVGESYRDFAGAAGRSVAVRRRGHDSIHGARCPRRSGSPVPRSVVGRVQRRDDQARGSSSARDRSRWLTIASTQL